MGNDNIDDKNNRDFKYINKDVSEDIAEGTSENSDEELNGNSDKNTYLEADKDNYKNKKDITDGIENITEGVTNVNILKEEIAKLPLNPEQKVYYETEIIPLIGVLDSLSKLSYNVSNSASEMADVRLSRNSKIEDALKLAYDANKSCREVYEVLKYRMDFLLYPYRYK